MIKHTYTAQSLKSNMPMMFGVIAILLVTYLSSTLSKLEETRWYRDLIGLTPFHSVQLYTSTINNIGLEITGELTKRRCVFRQLTGYIIFEGKARIRVPMLNSKGEVMTPVNGSNRPASNKPETWGPWTIINRFVTEPIRWEVYAHHVQCPDMPITQENLFMSGEWKDFNIESDLND